MSDGVDKVEQFRELVASHDVTFEYSEDITVWRAGRVQRNAILSLAKELPTEVVAEIWNKRMDEYLIADEAPNWYWKATN